MAAKRIEWAQKLRGENCRKLATDLDGNGAEGRPLPSDGTSFVPNCRKRGNEFLTSSSGLIGGREVGRAFGATEGLDTATRQAAAAERTTPDRALGRIAQTGARSGVVRSGGGVKMHPVEGRSLDLVRNSLPRFLQ